jgi:peptide/nickel transport system ATP-binding protein/peptide/nickel transport system permease protein
MGLQIVERKPAVTSSSLFNFWRLFRRNRMALVGLVMLVLVFTAAIFAALLAPYDPKSSANVNSSDVYNPPSQAHWLGTDDAGRDILSGFLYGTRVSLTVGFFAAFISVIVGGAIGIIAGFYGGRTENILMRFTDTMLVIPYLPLIIVIVALTKPSLLNIILVIGLFGWTTTARIVRSQTLAVKSRKFVLRARAIGAGNGHIIRYHILPLVMPLLVVNVILVVSTAILSESSLSFLGLGDPSVISWGQMISFAFDRGAMSSGAWWAFIFPGLGIVWVVLSLTLLGQGLEQVLNPRLESHHLMPGRPSVQSEAVNVSAGTQRKSKRRKDAPLLLDVRNLSINYVSDDAVAKAVHNVSLQLHEGELIGLVGESGCGKTTLMLALMRLLPAAGQIANGHIFFRDKDITKLSEEELEMLRWSGISIIFQGAMNALNPVRTIGDQIKEAILKHLPSYPPGTLDDRVIELLDLVGIAKDHKDQYPHQYSGGMRQRAMIAMALSCDPEVVIADEPTTALDVMIQAQILELLDGLRKKLGLAIIFVTHDLGVVAEMCDSVLVMYGGVTAEYADVDTIYNAPRHPYTQELLKSFPDLSQPEKRLVSIPGYPPKLDELPSGCRFAPRCPMAFERCTTEMPELHELEDGYHLVSCHLVEGG